MADLLGPDSGLGKYSNVATATASYTYSHIDTGFGVNRDKKPGKTVSSKHLLTKNPFMMKINIVERCRI